MRLIIVRHGETVENKLDIVQGWSAAKLNELGIKQSKALAHCLKKEKIDIIYSSDLKRCKQSLRPLLQFVNLTPHYSKDLRERAKGTFFEGKERRILKEWENQNPGKILKGGETWADVGLRVSNFLKKNIPLWSGKNVLLMTHGGTMQVLLNLLFGKNNKHITEIEKGSPSAAITIVTLDDKLVYHLKELYSVAHLGELE